MSAGAAGSSALNAWTTTGKQRLDQFLGMHAKATGSAPGRRWETAPRRSALGADFGRLGFSFVDAVKAYTAEAAQHLDDLDQLVDYRNAISHANETSNSSIEAGGRIRATTLHFSRNRTTLDRLAHTMDRVVADELGKLLDIASPW